MNAALECSNLSVGYRNRPVLRDVGFALEPGKIVALLGPNGGGKTTLLKTLSGLIPALEGEIRIQGDDVKGLSAKEIARRIGFVPQSESWPFDFTVREVVAMGRMPVSNGFFDTAEDREAAETAMGEAECLDLKDRAVTELSGGERQRVLIARAIAQESPIVFLDEPTAHLDPEYQVKIAALMRKMADSGKSLIVAIHDLPTAGSFADRAALVHSGLVTAPAPIDDVLTGPDLGHAYATEFERLKTADGRLIVVPRARG